MKQKYKQTPNWKYSVFADRVARWRDFNYWFYIEICLLNRSGFTWIFCSEETLKLHRRQHPTKNKFVYGSTIDQEILGFLPTLLTNPSLRFAQKWTVSTVNFLTNSGNPIIYTWCLKECL